MPFYHKPRPADPPDEGKARQQLLSEIRELRARVAILEEAESSLRRAQDTLRESEGKYRSLFEAMQENFSLMEVIVDGQGHPVDYRFLEVNPALELYSGNSRERLVGLKHSDLMAAGGGAAEQKWFDIISRVGLTGKAESGEHYAAPTGRWAQYYAFSPRHGQCAVISTDITEQKRAGESLKLTGYSLDSVRDMVIWFCPDGRIYYVNNAACRHYGYSRDELLSMSIFDINPSYTRESWNDRWRELRRKGFDSYEIENRAKDGHWSPIEVTSTYIKYGDRELMVGYARDITERKRAEEVLQESRALLEAELADTRLLQSVSAELLYEDDARALYDKIIEAAARIMRSEYASMQMLYPERGEFRLIAYRGFTPQAAECWEWVGTCSAGSTCGEALRTGRRVIVPDVEQYDRMRGTEDLAMYRQTGIRACQTTPLFSRRGRLVGMISTHWRSPHQPSERDLRLWDILSREAADLIDRKLAEEALRESEARYRELVESSNSIILRSDRYGNIAFFNEFAQRFFGYAEEEILGRNAAGTIIPATDSAGRDLVAMLDDLLRHPEEYRTNVHQNRRKNGELIWVSWTNKAIYDDAGGLVGLLCVGNDITRLKQAEEELAAAKRQAELYLDLMGHDINNMHQVALGYLELARELPAGADRAGFLDKSTEVLQRSTKLIGNVRKLQKLHDGALRAQDIDVCRMLADIKSEYEAVSGKTIFLRTNGHDRCIAHASELLHDVFSNLVNNAVKHTGAGTKILLDLAVVEEGGARFCRVAVEDDGPGIPDDSKGRIFNRTHKGSGRGMGLGLYLVKSLVEGYNGRVWVEDRVPGDPGKGARFVVLLPAVGE